MINFYIKRYIEYLLTVMFFMICMLSINKSYSQDVNYRSQSLFIYKFTKHIFWPENYTQNNFVIGVYGNSPIVNELNTMASLKKAAKGQKIIIKKIKSLEDISKLHMIYIVSSKSRDLMKIVEKIGSKPTLIIAERGGMARKGACINFMVMENDVLKIEINKSQLSKQKLRISQSLLKLGFVVK